MNAIGYARVSTDGQATDGVSLDAQQARIRAWCEANGYTLVGLSMSTLGSRVAEPITALPCKQPSRKPASKRPF